MFRNRQSSETPGASGLMYSLVHCPAPLDLRVWVHDAPNVFASRGCGPQRSGGRGGAQRRSPTGGAANGTPRNTVTPLSVVPVSTPCATVVCGSTGPAATPSRINATTARKTTPRLIIQPPTPHEHVDRTSNGALLLRRGRWRLTHARFLAATGSRRFPVGRYAPLLRRIVDN